MIRSSASISSFIITFFAHSSAGFSYFPLLFEHLLSYFGFIRICQSAYSHLISISYSTLKSSFLSIPIPFLNQSLYCKLSQPVLSYFLIFLISICFSVSLSDCFQIFFSAILTFIGFFIIVSFWLLLFAQLCLFLTSHLHFPIASHLSLHLLPKFRNFPGLILHHRYPACGVTIRFAVSFTTVPYFCVVTIFLYH